MLIPLIIIATILIALYIYYYKVEKFTEEPVNIQDHVDGLAKLLSAVGSGNIPETSPYVETLASIPLSTALKLYLTSFSARTHYDNNVRVYIPEMQRWNNFITVNQSFFVKGAPDALTVSIRENGMKLKNVALEGLRSDELNNTDYLLKPFSASFAIKFNTDQKNVTDSLSYELFTISLETPNYVRLTLVNKDANNCEFELVIGESDNKITTNSIAKNDLMTGNPAIITITCNIVNNEISSNIFISKLTDTIVTFDDDKPEKYTLSTGNKLILGNSRISVNKNQSALDANLFAFMFFSSALTNTDHQNIATYINQQNSPATGILSTLNTTAAQQLQAIRDLIANNTTTQGTLQAQLDACKASIPPVVRAFGHTISMNGTSSVSSEELRACSALEIKNRLTTAVANAAATTTGTKTATSRFQLNIPELSNNESIVAIKPS